MRIPGFSAVLRNFVPLLLSCVGLPPLAAQTGFIQINPNASLAGNADALAAFERAASEWEARISAPFTVNISAGLDALGSNVIGSANSVLLEGSYSVIRNRLVASTTASGVGAVTAALPSAASAFTMHMPAGYSWSGNLIATKANLKAVGFTGLDDTFGTTDATITFSSGFAFDYDRTNGIDAGAVDFQTVAAHEIGHALGFISAVDYISDTDTLLTPAMLDLFRFNAAQQPGSLDAFTTSARELRPGEAAVLSDGSQGWAMSTVDDGQQASHWKDDDLTGQFIGLMDPTLAYSVGYGPSEADFRALALIGWDVTLAVTTAIPEPSTTALIVGVAMGAVVIGVRRRRR